VQPDPHQAMPTRPRVLPKHRRATRGTSSCAGGRCSCDPGLGGAPMRLWQEFVSRRLCTVYAGDGVPRSDFVTLVCKLKRRPLAPPCCAAGAPCCAASAAVVPPIPRRCRLFI
jgi:hypothetical protein